MKHSHSEIKKLQEYQAWGVPVERQVANDINAATSGLVLEQTGNAVENVLYASKSGRVEVITSLAITNRSNRDIKVYDIQLSLPFDATLHWIQPSDAVADYQLPAQGPYPFEASAVLNSRLGGTFSIHPGLPVEGLLLGEVQAALPPTFQHGSTMPIELTILADKGRIYAIVILLRVERQDRMRKPTDGVRRQRPFEPDELHALSERDERVRTLGRD